MDQQFNASITKNISVLIRNIRCTTLFLSVFEEENILSPEEIDQLDKKVVWLKIIITYISTKNQRFKFLRLFSGKNQFP